MTRGNLSHLWPGVPLALASALSFGASTPLSKVLLASVDPQLLAGLLYLGAGIGLGGVHLARSALGLPAEEAPLRKSDMPWLGAVILFGGIIRLLLLMLGLSRTQAASGALLLTVIWNPSPRWVLRGSSFGRTLTGGGCLARSPYWPEPRLFHGKVKASI
jgi:drug/metabolite transporter (DMT)-like permease